MTCTFAGPASKAPAHSDAGRSRGGGPRAKGALHGSLAAPWSPIKVIPAHGHEQGHCRGDET